jgi:hypothetical protein
MFVEPPYPPAGVCAVIPMYIGINSERSLSIVEVRTDGATIPSAVYSIVQRILFNRR